jgi:16S rRNA processing protein RimM
VDNSPVIVAKAVRGKGLKGELVAELLTDFPERFEDIQQFFAISPTGDQIAVTLESFSFQRDRVVLKLAGYDSIEAASSLIGYEFAVPDTDRVELEADEYYDWELEGCEVKTIDGKVLGRVGGIMRTGANNLLIIEAGENDSKLIPIVASIVTMIDKESKLIMVDPPEGLLEL